MHRGCFPSVGCRGLVVSSLRPVFVASLSTPRAPCHRTLPLDANYVGSRSVLRLKTRNVRKGDLQVGHAILGVGAPEAVLVVVVALVVFGPKGLAEAARSFGQMIRSFKPTIRELAEVSTDIKSTLQQEIGLDEIQRDLRNVVDPNTLIDSSKTSVQTPSSTSLTDDADPDIEAKRAESAKLAWASEVKVEGASQEAESVSEVEETTSAAEALKGLAEMTTEELEAELQRRKTEQEAS